MTAAEEPSAEPPRRSDRPKPLNNVTAVLGPTNTGKTHYAVERMLAHESGMIGLPLRLLAREIYDRIVAMRGPGVVALLTGEEKIVPETASYWVCTVEAMPLDRRVAFLAIDEIQLCSDPERGHTFTSRLLHARGTQETLFLGSATMRPVMRELLPGLQFMSRTRMSQLSYSGDKKVSRLPRRSAVVAFSAEQVYGLAELIRRQRGGAAVVMGALSPRTRNAQVALYQSGDVDFIVATDAIGMGLNMDIDHVAFAARRKFDGHILRDLKPHELAQIAGRAGRHVNDGTFGVTGDCPALDAETIDQIENHRFDPVRLLQWRNEDLDFGSIGRLTESLETAPATKSIVRARAATDLVALKLMATNIEIEARAKSEDHCRLLWSVCQIPDFQQTMIDDHVRLLTNIFVHLTDNNGKIPHEWISAHIERLDSTEGDIDALSTRLAHVRTWTFVSNRPHWLDEADALQGRAREIEDRLSDALHEQLTLRFVDRRTSVLMKRLHQDDILDVTVDDDGEVVVEKEYVGRLSGFQFMLDPRMSAKNGALEAKALRTVASKAIEPWVMRTSERLLKCDKRALTLQDQGVVLFEGHPVGRLKKGGKALSPKIELIASEMISDLLGADLRLGILTRLEVWLEETIRSVLAPLVLLNDAVEAEAAPVSDGPVPLGAERKTSLNGIARGIGFQLIEHFGALSRAAVADQVKSLSSEDRQTLRSLGVRFGEFSIFLPALLKPGPARLMVLLWAVDKMGDAAHEEVPAPPAPGITSLPTDPAWTDGFLAAAGFRRCRTRAVRIDILERIGNLIRKQRFPDAPKPKDLAALTPVGAPGAVGAHETPVVAGPDSSEDAQNAADGADAMTADEAAEAAEAEAAEAAEHAAGTFDAVDVESAAEAASDEGAPAEAAPEAMPAAPAEPTSDAVGDVPPQDHPKADAPLTDEAAAAAQAAQPGAMPEEGGQAAGTPRAPAPKDKPMPSGAFNITSEMLSLAGCSSGDFEDILLALNYRKVTQRLGGGEERVFWRVTRPHEHQHAARKHGPKREPRRYEFTPRSERQPADATAGGAEETAREERGGRRQGKPPGEKREKRVYHFGERPAAPERTPRPEGSEGRERHEHRDKGGRRDSKGPQRADDPQRQERARRHAEEAHRPREQRSGYDKDSPFAVLAQLKQTLKGDG